MPVHYTFLTSDGTEDESGELTPEQQAFLSLGEMGIGVPVLNRSTLDEFVRRADLLQAYVGTIWRGADGTPRIFGRADFTKLLPEARTNWSKRSKAEFDRLITRERDAYWASVDSRK